jgi:hypothetical protein
VTRYAAPPAGADKRTGEKIEQQTIEFVHFKDNPEPIGARVIVGWGPLGHPADYEVTAMPAERTGTSAALSPGERIALHRRMANSYYEAHARRSVQGGATYSEWVFARKCTGRRISEARSSMGRSTQIRSLRLGTGGLPVLAVRSRLRDED